LIVIPNQNLFLIANANTTFKEAFEMADEVLQQGVRGITDLMVMPGLINLDFADVRSVMQEMGKAMMGTGEASGDSRALEAAQKAIANPLLDGVSMRGAKGVIVSITGGDDMRLLEVDEAANHIRELVDPDANIIWGSAFNPDLEGRIRVSVVATGIEAVAANTAPAPTPEAPRVFSFSAPRREPARPMSDAPADADIAPPQAAATQPVTPPAASSYAPPEADSDELVLGAEAAVERPAEAPRPIAADPEPAADASIRRRWLTGAADEPAATEAAAAPADEAAPRKSGGTLFERMSGRAARGEEADREPLDIPRFLHRQNNQ
jgi:cell division protein FtsZ